MRYKVTQQPVNKHTEIVTGVSWSAANELLSVSDDKKVWLWNVEGEPQTQVAETDTFCTELLWFPTVQGRSKEAEVFVVGCTDGSFKLISKAGRVEKVVTGAHSGAVTALKWSNDGSSLATCGEDGAVKSWSRNGMFRANLAQARRPPPPPLPAPAGALTTATDTEDALDALDAPLPSCPVPTSATLVGRARGRSTRCAGRPSRTRSSSRAASTS